MGLFVRILDAINFVFLVIVALGSPLTDGQMIFPNHFYPDLLIKYNQNFIKETGHYLQVEKPHFYSALIWYHLLFNWPLSLASIYGFVARKSWFSKTCLVLSVSFAANMVPILGEFLGSGRGSDQLVKQYLGLLSIAILVVLRCFLSAPAAKTTDALKKTV